MDFTESKTLFETLECNADSQSTWGLVSMSDSLSQPSSVAWKHDMAATLPQNGNGPETEQCTKVLQIRLKTAWEAILRFGLVSCGYERMKPQRFSEFGRIATRVVLTDRHYSPAFSVSPRSWSARDVLGEAICPWFVSESCSADQHYVQLSHGCVTRHAKLGPSLLCKALLRSLSPATSPYRRIQRCDIRL